MSTVGALGASALASTSTDTAGGAAAGLWLAATLTWFVLVLIAGWKMYTKAGEAGWVALVPVLNTFALLKIVKRPLWWFVLLLIPVVNIIVIVIVMNDLARAFGRGIAMTLLLIVITPLGYLVLGFGQATYQLPKEPLLGLPADR